MIIRLPANLQKRVKEMKNWSMVRNLEKKRSKKMKNRRMLRNLQKRIKKMKPRFRPSSEEPEHVAEFAEEDQEDAEPEDSEEGGEDWPGYGGEDDYDSDKWDLNMANENYLHRLQ